MSVHRPTEDAAFRNIAATDYRRKVVLDGFEQAVLRLDRLRLPVTRIASEWQHALPRGYIDHTLDRISNKLHEANHD